MKRKAFCCLLMAAAMCCLSACAKKPPVASGFRLDFSCQPEYALREKIEIAANLVNLSGRDYEIRCGAPGPVAIFVYLGDRLLNPENVSSEMRIMKFAAGKSIARKLDYTFSEIGEYRIQARASFSAGDKPFTYEKTVTIQIR